MDKAPSKSGVIFHREGHYNAIKFGSRNLLGTFSAIFRRRKSFTKNNSRGNRKMSASLTAYGQNMEMQMIFEVATCVGNHFYCLDQ